MYVFGLVVFFIFGLLFGSFGNVVIYRLPRKELLSKPGSHCPACNKAIKPWNNIPVLSYLMLSGRCADCKNPISFRYPLIEFVSALFFALAYLMASNLLQAAALALVFYLLLLLSAIDIDTKKLPNPLVLALFILAVLSVAASHLSLPAAIELTPRLNSIAPGSFKVAPFFGAGNAQTALGSALLGLAVGLVPITLFSLLYYLIRKRVGFGMGDLKLMAALSPMLGLASLAIIPFAALFGLVAIVAGAKNFELSNKIPFGPFISLSTVFILFLGGALWDWYIGLML